MQTIDLVSAIISVSVLGILGLRLGLMVTTMPAAEVLWSRRPARVAVVSRTARSVPVRPLGVPPAR